MEWGLVFIVLAAAIGVAGSLLVEDMLVAVYHHWVKKRQQEKIPVRRWVVRDYGDRMVILCRGWKRE